MSANYEDFINTIESPGTVNYMKFMSFIGDYDYSNCTKEDLEKIILDAKPKTLRAITSICLALRMYAKYLENDRMYRIIDEIDRTSLWDKLKDDVPRRYISHSIFEEIYNDLGFEDFNALYKQTLFRAIYEGIYSKSLSVLKNLRRSDIHDNTVTLREDNGNSYDLEVSPGLIEDLTELSYVNVWERRHRNGEIAVSIIGLHHDSCFKVENRNGDLNTASHNIYTSILRKILKDLGYRFVAQQIYISGIVHRIISEFEKNNIDYKDESVLSSKNVVAYRIVNKELARSNFPGTVNYSGSINYFRETVRGYWNNFLD